MATFAAWEAIKPSIVIVGEGLDDIKYVKGIATNSNARLRFRG